MKGIANSITAFRFFLGVLIIAFSVMGNILFFSMAYLLNLLLDILDGYVARRLKEESETGKNLDIIADNFIVLCLMVSFYVVKKEMVMRYLPQIIFIAGYYFLIQLYSLLFFRRLIFMRTFAANLAAVLFPFMVLSALFYENKMLILLYGTAMIFSLTEKLVLTASRSKKTSVFRIGISRFIIFMIIFSAMSAIFFSIPVKKIACFRGSYCIEMEVRDTEEGRELGLMNRESLSEGDGMLFVFDSESSSPFWMKNMKIPIDIIFIGQDKKIISIAENAIPCNKPDNECELYFAEAAYRYVIEVREGFSSRHGLRPGSAVDFSEN